MKHWFIKTNNKTVGPVSSEQLRQWVADGTVLRTTMVRSNESEDFVPADKLKGLFKPDSVALDQGRTDRRSGANQTSVSQEQNRQKLAMSFKAYLVTACAILAVGAIWWASQRGEVQSGMVPYSDAAQSTNVETAIVAEPIGSNIGSLSMVTTASQIPKKQERQAPKALPVSLPPLPVPDLSRVRTPDREPGPEHLPNSVQPELEFPKSFSGVSYGFVPYGYSNSNGMLGIDVDLESFGPEVPRRFLLSRVQEKRFADQQRIKPSGGQGYQAHLLKMLTTSFSRHARTVKGRVRLYRIKNPNLSKNYQEYINSPRKEVGSLALTGWVDPSTLTFALWPEKWEPNQDKIMKALRHRFVLHGCWHPEANSVSGWGDSPVKHFFLSSSEQDADELLQDAIAIQKKPDEQERKAIKEVYKLRSPSLVSKRELEMFQAKATILEAMLKPVYDDLYRRISQKQAVPPRPKFSAIDFLASDQFVELVGAPYEKSTHLSRLRLSAMMDQVSIQSRNRERTREAIAKKRLNSQLSILLQEKNHFELRSFVMLQKAKQRWMNHVTERLEAEAAYQGCFEDFEQTNPWRELALAGRSIESIDLFRRRLEVVLKKRAAAELAALRHVPTEKYEQWLHSRMSATVDAKDLHKYLKQVELNRQNKLEAEFVSSFNEIVSAVDNVDATYEVGAWIQKMNGRFKPLENSEVHKVVRAYAQKRHKRLMETYLADVVYRLDTASTDDEVKKLSAGVLMPVGWQKNNQRLLVEKAVKRNRERVLREQQLRFYSQQEQSWMSPNSLVINVPDVVPEPTAESIKIAFYRELARLPYVRWETPDRIKFSSLWLKQFGASVKIKILEVTKVADPNGQTAISEGDGFRCFYRFKPKITMPKMGSENDPRQRFFEGLSQAASGSAAITTTSNVFILTREGWRSPTIRARGIENVVKINLGG